MLTALIVTPHLRIGGEEISSLRICRELRRRGHRAIFVSSSGPLEQEVVAATEFESGPTNGRTPSGIAEGAEFLRQLVESTNADVVHCQTAVTAIMGAMSQRRSRRRVPVIWHDRTVHTWTYPVMGMLCRRHLWCIANSRYEKGRLTRWGMPANRCHVIYNGFDLDDFAPGPHSRDAVRTEWGVPADGFVVGSVGRLAPVKGFPYLIRACERLRSKMPHLWLVIVGGGPCRDRLLGMGARQTILVGARRDIPRQLAGMDVFATPSLHESFGNVVAEAMAAGIPAISTTAGGLPEAAGDGKGALMVPPRDVDALSAAIERVAADREFAAELAARGRRAAAERFDVRRLGAELEAFYLRVAATPSEG
jgi:glycosyltransferase involved in cell wall biosynthesis